jgi:cytochrome P450
VAAFEEQAFAYDFESMRLLTRELFLCNTPDAVQFAFGTHNDSFERKSPSQRQSLFPLLGDGLFVSDGGVWRDRRRVVAPMIHVSRLSELAPLMVEAALETRQRWGIQLPLTELDVLSEMAHLAAEIICRTIFGRQLGRDCAIEIVKGFTDYQGRIGRVDLMSLIGLPDWLPRPHLPGVYRAARRIHAVLDDIIANYRARRDRDEMSDEMPVIGRLLDARDESGAPLDAKALRDEVTVLFMAGHETTANTLAWAWYLLSQVPGVERRFHTEIDEVLGGRLPALTDVPKLLYTRAIFEEVMRLYPPVPVLSREALREETYRGKRIRRGSLIIVSPWLLHRHRKLWSAPDHFVPERFLSGSGEPVSKFAYIPFSIGPRICAGMAFGLTEAILCIATLAQQFKLRLKCNHRVEVVCRLTLRPGDSLPMYLVPRAHRVSASDAPSESAQRSCPFIGEPAKPADHSTERMDTASPPEVQ